MMIMNVRASVQRLIDEFQFVVDVFPNGEYQPLPWIGLRQGKRGEGTLARWQAIEPSLEMLNAKSAADIGCNLGFFCLAMARRGMTVIGIDLDSRYLRVARYAARKTGSRNISLCQMEIRPDNTYLLPQVDVMLVLSVWHHWVKAFGLIGASDILKALWERSNMALFFETGQTEMTADFGLGMMTESPCPWIKAYLISTCNSAEITHLGVFKAFGPGGNENQNVAYRDLFQVTRRNRA